MADFTTDLKMLGLQLSKKQINDLRSKALSEIKANKINDFLINTNNEEQIIIINMALIRAQYELMHLLYRYSILNDKKLNKDFRNLKNKAKMVSERFEEQSKKAPLLNKAFLTIADEFSEMIYQFIDIGEEEYSKNLNT